jgi:hypothetical protein
MFSLGSRDDPWRLSIPDIRMARNQYWPLHWHDCWIAIVILDGSCLVGDWWMEPGDVLISPARAEYGPLLNGPKGCQLLEIFARDVDSGGGYAPEFHDHPTLAYLQRARVGGARFLPRPKGSEGNAGNQTTPLATVHGLLTGHLSGGQRWDLGEAEDPERGVLLDTKLPPGTVIPTHRHGDWYAALVLDGEMRFGDEQLRRHDLLIIEPDAHVPTFEVGTQGLHLVQFARTAAGATYVFREADRQNPAYSDGLAAVSDAAFA